MSETLLLADDNVTMQRVVELTFAEQGLKVVSVSDGLQAIDYITGQRPAMALVSVTLPKVNGFDVARFVRDRAENRVPVLLLAGAFDNLDEAQVRESGAAGVLVKPFEPAVVIKRVKELLGIKSAPPPARPPASSSGRLVTSSEGPGPAPPPPTAARPTPPGTAPLDKGEAWERLRDDGALGGAAPVEGPGRGGDYLDHLDAAFDSLDAQLAGRPAPAGRATHSAPAPSMPAAIDPGRRPRAVDEDGTREASEGALPEGLDATAPREHAPNPVFEVDDNWFDKKHTPVDSLSDLTAFVVTRASDFHAPQPSTPVDQDRSWLPADAPAREVPEASVGATSPDPSASDREMPQASGGVASTDAPDAPRAPTAPAPPGANAADAFATLWAQEQGEPVPAPAPSAPVDLTEQSVDALTAQLTARVAARLGAPLADRLTKDLTEDLSVRLTSGIADRLMSTVADRLADQMPGPIAAGVSERIGGVVADRVTAGLADRLAERLTADLATRLGEDLGARLVNDLAARIGPALLERLTANLGERLSAGLAERVGELVAERTVQGALGDSLRQTVHDVAERVVRAEIERIKAAASRA